MPRSRKSSPPSTEAGILDRCGAATSEAGRLLWQTGAVSERLFIEGDLVAVVQAGRHIYEVEFEELGGAYCDCPDAARGTPCAHVAAMLWAWVKEPHTFEEGVYGDDEDDEYDYDEYDEDDEDEIDLTPGMMGDPALQDIIRQLMAGQDVGELTRQAQGLLWGGKQPAGAPALPAPPPQAETPQESWPALLSSCRLEDLRAIAKRHNWKLSGTAKDGIVKQLDGYLKELADSGSATAGLSGDEAWLVRYLGTILGEDAAPTHDFLEDIWRKAPGKRAPRKLNEVIDALFAAGLLFPCGEGGQAHYHILPHFSETSVPVLAITLKPLDARARGRLNLQPHPPILDELAGLAQALETQRVSRRAAPPPHPREARYAWLRDWKYDAADVQRLIESRQADFPRPDVGLAVRMSLDVLSDEALRLAQAWTGAPPERITWLLDVGLFSRLFLPPATREPGAPFRLDGQAWAEWEASSPDPAQRIKRLWQAWLTGGSDVFFELAWAARRHGNLAIMRAIAASLPKFTPFDLMNELALARRSLARVLAGLLAASPSPSAQDEQANAWLAWNTVAQTIFDLHPNLLNTYFTRQNWWLATAAGAHKRYNPGQRGDWDKSVRHVLAATIEGPLQWLGAVELGYERSTLAALRVTPLGHWLLTGRGQPPEALGAPRAGEPPAWIDAHTWRMPAGAGSAEMLSTCRVLGEPADRPFTFRLSDAGIERALLSGATPQVMAAHFEAAGIPIPPAAMARIEQAAGRIGRLRLYEGLALIECADELALKEILAGTRLKEQLVCQLSPRLAVIRAESVDPAIGELIDKGYTPRVQ
ncbi:MAG: helicase-associated domain-containing protein [Thermoflexales bacterium]|nr:helicase-associated domain-containing protein [Thermoflexales bacterium]